MSTLVMRPAELAAATAPPKPAAAATSPAGLGGIQQLPPSDDRRRDAAHDHHSMESHATAFSPAAAEGPRSVEGGGSSTGRLYVKGASEIVLELCRWQVSWGSMESVSHAVFCHSMNTPVVAPGVLELCRWQVVWINCPFSFQVYLSNCSQLDARGRVIPLTEEPQRTRLSTPDPSPLNEVHTHSPAARSSMPGDMWSH